MKRLIALFLLLPLVAFGQLMPIQRNFFTTNPAPVVTVSAGSNVTVQATTTFNTRTFTVNGQTDTNVVNLLATNVSQNTTIYGSNVVGAVSQASHATNADNATYVTTATLTNQVYGSNTVGAVAQATHATNADNATYAGFATNAANATNFWGVLNPTNLPTALNYISNYNGVGTNLTAYGGKLYATNPAVLMMDFTDSVNHLSGSDYYPNLFLCGAGNSSMTGWGNMLFGWHNGISLTTGSENLAMGWNAGAGMATANYNVLLGHGCGYNITNGEYNVMIGHQPGHWLGAGMYNIGIGYNALYNDVNKNSNVSVGHDSCFSLTNGTANTALGDSSGRSLQAGDYNIFIGYNAGFHQLSTSYALLIDPILRADTATELTNSLIYGVANLSMAGQTLQFNAGNTTVNGNLTVNGSLSLPGGASVGYTDLYYTNSFKWGTDPTKLYADNTGFFHCYNGSVAGLWTANNLKANVYVEADGGKVRIAGSGIYNTLALSGYNGGSLTNLYFGTGGYTNVSFRFAANDTYPPTMSIVSGTNSTANVAISGTIGSTNGVIFQGKHSFTTNFTMLNSINIYECNGTNQTITMLDTTNSTPWQIYRFASTNGHGKFTLQTAQADQTIRDGTSTTFVQVGIGSPSFYHDGKHWWSAARTRVVFPNACWSLTTNLLLTADVITNVPFNQLEFNNSQGIALVAPGKFYITNSGQYMITFSAVINGGGNNTSLSLWMRQSGVDVPRSRTRQVFTSATAQQCMTVNYIFNVSTNDTYFELYAGSHDTGAGIISEAANPTTYTAPVQPGVILTVNKVSDTYP